jgi:nitrate/TMAO reductase-like tetraheme cytochrome c subunit
MTMTIDTVQIVRVVGTLLCVLGVLLCWRVGRKRFAELRAERTVSIGIATVSAMAFWKLLAFAGLVVVPAAAVGVANYHTFEGVHEVAACARCHVMRPMVTDLHDPASDTLAARHFKNRWIPKDQCFHCHSDYGLSGDMEAKMTGFRHLARYTTHSYHEPIRARTRFNNDNCLKCHGEAPKFNSVSSHHTVHELLAASTMSCLNCHGRAHPTQEARTPGSPDYDRLMRGE